MLSLSLFGSLKKGICVAFSQTLSPCVFICLCVATEASGLYRYSCCVYPWSCCLFIIRPPYCEDAHSIFKVSTTQSLSRYLNHSTCWILHTQQQIWKSILFQLFDPTDTSSLPFLFLFHNIRRLLDPMLTFSFNLLVSLSSSLSVCPTPQREQLRGIYPTQEPVKGMKILSGTIEEVCESSPQKYIEPVIN